MRLQWFTGHLSCHLGGSETEPGLPWWLIVPERRVTIWPGLADLGTYAVLVISPSASHLRSLPRQPPLRVFSSKRTHATLSPVVGSDRLR